MTNAALAINANIIDVQLARSNMRAYVDIGKYWQEGLSVNAVYEDLIMKGMKIDRRTLSSAKDGTLARSEYSTLIRLRDWVREISGNTKLCIDDILVIKHDE
ncbi:hypothetical protein NIES4102_43530 (plasmid) [Chondrocystis sp. NIES-4102]|nr:hypothetical protein NIES4102_43530 [Chondrocystis sp. NIES-4102]